MRERRLCASCGMTPSSPVMCCPSRPAGFHPHRHTRSSSSSSPGLLLSGRSSPKSTVTGQTCTKRSCSKVRGDLSGSLYQTLLSLIKALFFKKKNMYLCVQDFGRHQVTFIPFEEDAEGKVSLKGGNVYQIQLLHQDCEEW